MPRLLKSKDPSNTYCVESCETRRMFILAISALAATLNNKRGIEYPGNSLKDAPATLKHKRESVVGILYPSEIKNFQVEQCTV